MGDKANQVSCDQRAEQSIQLPCTHECATIYHGSINTGQYGKVYKATLVQARSEDMTVEVKTINRYKSEQETSDFLHEMRVMMDLMHPNIIHIYGIVQQGIMKNSYMAAYVLTFCMYAYTVH